MITLMYMCTYIHTMQCYAHMCTHGETISHRRPEDSLLWLCVPCRLASVTTVTQFSWIKPLGRERGRRPWWPSAPPSSRWVRPVFSLKSFRVRPLSHEDSAEGWHGPRGACLLFLVGPIQSQQLRSAQRGQALCLTSSCVSSIIILRGGHCRASFRHPQGGATHGTAQPHPGNECLCVGPLELCCSKAFVISVSQIRKPQWRK